MQSNIRNFAIIAHVDHGKSTLSDRFLELTHTVPKDKLKEQFLDQNPISRERGITIKLAPVRMHYKNYILNLIDTPGHVDFSYDVSRTLAACEGAILLVDATQGIQAQTVAHLRSAREEGLLIIPVINKIDMPQANTDAVVDSLIETLNFSKDEIVFVSAKTGQGVNELLDRIISRIPSPKGNESALLRALIFDAVYDEHKGVVAFVRVIDGKLERGNAIGFAQNSTKADAVDVGYFSPALTSSAHLLTGEIGYIVTGVKDIRLVRVGDTIKPYNAEITTLAGYKAPQPMVFFGVYPQSPSEFANLREALAKLMLSDASLTLSEEYSAFLGSGFRVGFLGLLHADIIKERLSREFGVTPLLTMPQVLYKHDTSGQITEPYMILTIFTPNTYVGSIMTLCQKKKGTLLDMKYAGDNAILSYDIPYSMFIRGLSASLKSVSQGFASFDYELNEYKPANVVTLEMKINDVSIDVLSEQVYKEEAEYVARRKAEELKESLPRNQFRQIIQGVIGGKIVAREEISPYRKDVLQKMSGGDRTRKDKLLEAQKKGKKRLAATGKISLPQEALFSLLKKD